jgi:hypothetical protein
LIILGVIELGWSGGREFFGGNVVGLLGRDRLDSVLRCDGSYINFTDKSRFMIRDYAIYADAIAAYCDAC